MLLTRPVPILTHVVESVLPWLPCSPPVRATTTTKAKVRQDTPGSNIDRLSPRLASIVRHVQHDTAARVGRASRPHLLELPPPLPGVYALETGLRNSLLRDLPSRDGCHQAITGASPTSVVLEVVETKRPRCEVRALWRITTQIPMLLAICLFSRRVTLRVQT